MLGAVAAGAFDDLGAAFPPASAKAQQKPNIMFIVADDIGWMRVGAYHRWGGAFGPLAPGSY